MRLEKEYRRLLEEIEEAYILIQDEKIVYANDRMVELAGYTKNEVYSRAMGASIAPEERERIIENYHRKLAGKPVPKRYETVIVAKGGKRIPIEISPWLTQCNGKPAIATIIVDITERTRHQADILKAQEEERKHLSQTLHDETIQDLLLVIHRLQDVSAGTYGRCSSRVSERLAQIRKIVENTVNEVRKFTEDLRPDILVDMGLVPALRWLLNRLDDGDGIQAEVCVFGEERRLSPETELALFRIAQEALSNIRKHARATTVTLLLDFRGKKVVMTINDDGIGFEIPATAYGFTRQHKLGIAGIGERVRLLGGKYKIESSPGKGTVIKVEIAG